MSEARNDLDALGDDVKTSWHRFLDVFEPMRPELYRYCRHLTRSPWDAEDLAQDALMRAFVTLGTMFTELPIPRERVAVVLKDVFDFSLDEIAEALATTTGAVKIALHRGRGRLVAPERSSHAHAGARGARCVLRCL